MAFGITATQFLSPLRTSTKKKKPACEGGLFRVAKSRDSAACSVFQLRGRLETQTLRRLDLDRFAGARIAAHAGCALGHGERAEGSDLIFAAVLHGLEA